MSSSLYTCKNCQFEFTGQYCNNCGEKVYHEEDKKVSHLFDQAFHFISHFEGTFFSTLKTIALKPGKYSFDYCNGIRKKYFKPISLFLILVILYLIFPMLRALNMELVMNMESDFFGNYATKKVA
jgi:hypothetical protein